VEKAMAFKSFVYNFNQRGTGSIELKFIVINNCLAPKDNLSLISLLKKSAAISGNWTFSNF
jgi:hypothetical protein